MTPKERLHRRIKGEKVDKIPNLNITMLFAAAYAGIPYGKFCSDYRYLVEAQIKTAEDFGIDILSTMSDPFRETSDYGAFVEFAEDDLPICREILLRTPEDLDKIKSWNPEESVRMLDRIRAVEYYRINMGEQYPVLGWVEGALAEFADLAHLQEMMIYLVEEPEFAHEVLERLTEQQIACAKAQIRAGADVIGIGDACASLINSAMYREFALPYERRMVEAIQGEGALVKLHICGNISHLLGDVRQTGADIIDIDSLVNLETAADVLGDCCSVCGNSDPTIILLQGSTEKVEADVTRCIHTLNDRGIISAGCEVPRATPVENLRTVDRVLRERSVKQ